MAMTAVRMGADERRELVVKAALTEFAKAGLAGTSTEAIAKRAGISQPYIFRLFATKKDLFIAVVDACFGRVYDAFLAAADGKFGEVALDAMGDAYTELLQDRELLLSQMHTYTAASDDPDVREAARNGYRRLWLLVERATGLPDECIVQFFAMGMLINVAATMDLPRLDEPWAKTLIALSCPGFSSL
jgi:AcrR family transcriptional regulator